MQDRVTIIKKSNIKSFIGISVSLHLTIIGIIVGSYFCTQNTVSANQSILEHSVKIDLSNISLPNQVAVNQDENPPEVEPDTTETEIEKNLADEDVIETKEEILEDKIIEEDVTTKHEITTSQEETQAKIIQPIDKKEKDKVKKKKKTKDQQLIKKTSPKKEDKTKSTAKTLNNTTTNASNQNEQPSVLIKSVNPQYPKKALDLRIEGYVIVAYDINADGKPENIRIIESKPNNIFNSAVITAIKQWRYKPDKKEHIQLRFMFNHKQKQIQFESEK